MRGAAIVSLLLAACSGTIRGGADGDQSGSAAGQGSDADAGTQAERLDGGVPGDGDGGATVDPDGPGGEPPIDCAAEPIDPGPSPLRLLTRAHYVQTVRDLFEPAQLGESALHAALGPATNASAFGLLQPDVTQVELEGFQKAAELIAKAVIDRPEALEAIAPCAEGEDAAGCARTAIERFGARLYRAPLSDETDVLRHLALFEAGARTSYAHGIELLLRGMLQAPRFLYRVELGTDERVSEHAVRLTPHELAARLSYLAWGTAPDALLIEAAERGELASAKAREAQLTRLLDDPRGAPLMRRFLLAWAHLDSLAGVIKDEDLYPEWQDAALRTALEAQATRFFDDVLAGEGGTLHALLTSRRVPVNDALASFYALDDIDGEDFTSVEVSEGRASGVLTLPALLAKLAKPDESSPIYRGKFVRELLLCQELPAPPANIPPPPEVQAGVSTRERLRQHEEDVACSGCHQLLDPIGFAFEHFDAIGRYRSEDGGEAVDARGALHRTRDADGALEGIAQLGARLAASKEVEECMTRQFFRFALERFEQDVDACTLQRLVDRFAASGQDLRALPAAILASDAFLYRRPIEEDAP